MSQDFSKGKIYKITNDFNDHVYVGSTCDLLTKRFSGHKKSMYSIEKKERPLYKLMNEIGFERFRIELLEEFPCQDKYQLRQREGYWIREIGTLNKRIECRTEKEYYIDNKEEINEYKKKWVETNKEHVKEYKQKIYQNNVDKIKEHNKTYYEENKSKIHENITCECGLKSSKQHLQRHKQSKRHIELMKINQTEEVYQNCA
jgi:group I intron endonuclease